MSKLDILLVIIGHIDDQTTLKFEKVVSKYDLKRETFWKKSETNRKMATIFFPCNWNRTFELYIWKCWMNRRNTFERKKKLSPAYLYSFFYVKMYAYTSRHCLRPCWTYTASHPDLFWTETDRPLKCLPMMLKMMNGQEVKNELPMDNLELTDEKGIDTSLVMKTSLLSVVKWSM